MMTAPELTLQNIKQSAKQPANVVRVSDFLSDKKKKELREAQEARYISRRRRYDDVDAYSAEILARFGYDAWEAWNARLIKPEKMLRFVLAERSRDKQKLLGLESLILSALVGANNPTKSGHPPKSLKNAIKILKQEQARAKGVING